MAVKAAVAEQFAAGIRDAEAYRRVRAFARSRRDEVLQELTQLGFVDENGMLTTSTKPFNVFARLAAGAMPLRPHMVTENRWLEESGHASRFMVCDNLPEADAEWESREEKWLGRASMSKRHRFLTSRDLSWSLFNALVFGMESTEQLAEAVHFVEAIIAAARAYTQKAGYSSNVGLYFHIYGLSSVNSLHLHMLDLDYTGPTFEDLNHKNLPADAVLSVLQEELATQRGAALSKKQEAPPVPQGKVRAMTMTYACPIAIVAATTFLMMGALAGALLSGYFWAEH